jgi:hypothetical protein
MTETLLLTTLVLAIAAWASWYVIVAVRTHRRLAGVRVVICPETGKDAAVRLDWVDAAMATAADDKPDLRLADCSRWATRGRCDEPCVPQAAAQSTRVTSIVDRWEARSHCALCGKPVTDAPFIGHHAGLLSPDGRTTEWTDVAAENLPKALDTRRAICWNCHVAETFRREHPELVTDR